MKLLIFLALFQLPIIGFAEIKNRVDVDITNVEDHLLNCDCKIPAHLGRICIRQTRWKLPEVGKNSPAESFTRFEAKIDGDNFVLTSTAYYYQCVNETMDKNMHYVNEFYINNFLPEGFKTDKYYQNIGLKGLAPRMKVAFLQNLNSTVSYEPQQVGLFKEQKDYFIKGGVQEFYRLSYPGTVKHVGLLKNLLSDTEVKRILDEGVEYTRYLKSWLSIHTFLVVPNPVVDFGEFTIKLRFYRQAETNSIGIEVIE